MPSLISFFTASKAAPLLAFDMFDLAQNLRLLLGKIGPVDFGAEQFFTLGAGEIITADDTADPLGGQGIGVRLAFDQNEAAFAAVLVIGGEHGMGGSTGAGEGVEN